MGNKYIHVGDRGIVAISAKGRKQSGSVRFRAPCFGCVGILHNAERWYADVHVHARALSWQLRDILNAVGRGVHWYTHGTNSGKFQGVCVGSGGTEATVDLGITVAVNTGYVLAVCFDKARTEARFYINGALAGIVTSQIPAATSTGDRTLIIKSAGTTIRSANVAYKTFFALY